MSFGLVAVTAMTPLDPHGLGGVIRRFQAALTRWLYVSFKAPLLKCLTVYVHPCNALSMNSNQSTKVRHLAVVPDLSTKPRRKASADQFRTPRAQDEFRRRWNVAMERLAKA